MLKLSFINMGKNLEKKFKQQNYTKYIYQISEKYIPAYGPLEPSCQILTKLIKLFPRSREG